MAQVKIKTDELEEKLKLVSSKMEQGNTDALYEMKRLLEDCDCRWVEVSKQIKPRVFSVIWVLNALIGELWSNLGADCAGFPKKEGTPYILEITKQLGQFTQQALSMELKEDRDPFCQAVTKVFELFRLVDERLMKEGRKPAEEWCVL
jgi:hypothetical protein